LDEGSDVQVGQGTGVCQVEDFWKERKELALTEFWSKRSKIQEYEKYH